MFFCYKIKFACIYVIRGKEGLFKVKSKKGLIWLDEEVYLL